MGVILGLVFVIAGVLLYDYFTARRWQQVTSGIRNNIVFENRNKMYGAYVLRRDYDKRMVLIMTGVILFLGLSFTVFKIIQSIEPEKIETKQQDLLIFDVPVQEDKALPPPPPEPTPPPEEKMVEFFPPVVLDKEVDTKLPTEDELEKTNAGDKTQDGKEGFNDPVEYQEPIKEVEKVIEKVEEPLTFVDEEAQFNGNMMEYIQKKLVYPPDAIDMGLSGKCYLKFVVEVDGNISNVSVIKGVPDCPQCDKEAIRVVKSMPNWKPGKNGGKAVRTWCQVPLNFTLH